MTRLIRPRHSLRRLAPAFGSLFLMLASMVLVPTRATARQPNDTAAQETAPFLWNNAVVYTIVTDRLANGDASNDRAYGHYESTDSTVVAGRWQANGVEFGADGHVPDVARAASFQGGDFQGIASLIRRGYFSRLGITAIRLSPPFEQVRGPAADAQGGWQEAYHGEWTLDFTEIDERFGGAAGLRDLIDAARATGIRVLLDINLNSAGPPTDVDRHRLGFGWPLPSSPATGVPAEAGIQPAADTVAMVFPAEEGIRPDNDSLGQTVSASPVLPTPESAWGLWWGPAWIRANYPGYEPCGDEPLTECVRGAPDFRTEIGGSAGIPEFLIRKWGPDKAHAEVRGLDDWFARRRHARMPRHYLVKWVTDWVRVLGVDGFHALDASFVDIGLWGSLKAESELALEEYFSMRGESVQGRPVFWLTGDTNDGGSTTTADTADAAAARELATALHSRGFDALVEPLLPRDLVSDRLDSLYTARAASIATNAPRGVTSSLQGGSPGGDLGMAAYLLLPGTVALPFAFDFDAPPGSAPDVQEPSADDIPSWATVARFRSRHPAVGAGSHQRLSAGPYSFQRSLRSSHVTDVVVVVLGAKERTRVNVSGAFPDDAIVREAMTGATAFVSFGYVTVAPHESGIVLLELAEQP